MCFPYILHVCQCEYCTFQRRCSPIFSHANSVALDESAGLCTTLIQTAAGNAHKYCTKYELLQSPNLSPTLIIVFSRL